MKTKNFLLTLVALIAFAGNAWAQRDITSQYITNAKLSDGTNGWTVNNFNTPVRGNNTEGYASECYAGWESLEKTAYSLKQTITLPAGSYRLVNYSFFRYGLNADTDVSKSQCNLFAGNTSVPIKTLGSITGVGGYANSQAEGANCFDSKMYRNVVEFTIAADNTQIEIGLDGTFDLKQSWVIAGMFELFDLDDLASVSSPTDMTYAITNPGFEYRNTSGWTSTGDFGNYADGTAFTYKAGIGMVEKWSWVSSANYTGSLKQTLTGLENGLYEVSVYAGNIRQQAGDAAGTGMYLVANNDQTAIGTHGKYTVRTTVTDNTLNLGINMTGATGNWVVWDRFGLLFYGDPLAAYKDLLADKVAEAQALVDGGTLRTGAANQLQTIINANDNDDDAFTTEAEFDTAISNIEAGMTQANQIAATYASFDNYKDIIDNLADGQPASDELTTFQNTLTTLTSNVANATDVATIEAQVAALYDAGMTYITTADGQFDITFLASQVYSDWKKKDGSAAGIVADQFLTNRPSDIPSFAESYETTCATTGTVLYQTIEGLPAGYYQVGMYAAAMFTEGRGFNSEATNGDANRTFAFAGDLNDPSSILRTGAPISFATVRDFNDLTTLDVNVHLTGSGNTNNLTFGVQKDENGSNWHFAQILSIVYSNQPDLTNLKATRDNLVAEAEGLLAGSSQYLTAEQQQALQAAITAGEAADDFESLNTVTLTTLPDAINTAKQQVAQAKASIPTLHAALERFEQYYNLEDGTDYSRLTMSAKAWTDLLEKVDDATEALDDISQVAQYASIASALNDQMDATDVSIRLFKSYKAMVEGCQSLNITEGTTYAADTWMDTDDTEQTAIGYLNAAFVAYSQNQYGEIDMAGFLGDNLDFSGTEAAITGLANVKDIAGWEESYSNISDDWAFITTKNESNTDVLYVRANWQSAATLTTSKLKMLPVGKYKLSFDWNSDLANMNNLSAYKLGETSTTLGETTSASQTLEYEFEVTENATDFDLVFGFTRTATGSAPAQILVDNVNLVCIVGDEFKLAYEAAQAVDDNTAATAAAKSAITEYADNYASTADLNGFADAEARQAAISVLKNAKTIAQNGGDATSLVVNGDLTNTTVTDRAPAGWTTYYEGSDGGDIWVRTQEGSQVFNIWTGGITLIDMTQAISNLPKGAYRLSIDMGTDGFREDGSAPLFNFINPSNMDIGASELVTTKNTAENRAFATYTSAAEVGADHQATIGIRSEGNYFQMKNVRLEYIGDVATAATETDNSFVRQDFFWQDKGTESGSEINLDNADKYANAQNVKVYPTGVNKIIHGLSGQFAETVPNADNGGTCASLVITDGNALTNTKAFDATAATYSRNMPSYNEGANYREWGTLILPYQVASDENVRFYTMNKVVEDEVNWMSFTPVATVPANTPVVFSTLNSQAVATMAGSGTVATTTAEQGSSSVDFDGWSLEGVYTSTQFTGDDAAGLYYVAQDKFWKASTTNATGLTVAPFRAFFHGPETSSVKSFNIRVVDGDATSIVDLEHGVELGGDVYTVGGQLVRKNAMTLEGLPQGVYIVGGKKVIIR